MNVSNESSFKENERELDERVLFDRNEIQKKKMAILFIRKGKN